MHAAGAVPADAPACGHTQPSVKRGMRTEAALIVIQAFAHQMPTPCLLTGVRACMQPELFLLAPRHAGSRQGERRRTLLNRRADLLELVGAEEELPEELQLHNIRRMPLPDHHISDQAVWALPAGNALHATVEDIHEASPYACWPEVRTAGVCLSL